MKRSGWYNEPRRHGLASKGISTTIPKSEAMIKAPLASQSTKLPLQLSINIPSTRYDQKISPEEYKKRIKEAAREFSNRFGGDTSLKGKGDYTSNGKLITEDVTIVETSMTEKDYEKNKEQIERFLKKKREEWKQETIGYSFEDNFYIYPKFD